MPSLEQQAFERVRKMYSPLERENAAPKEKPKEERPQKEAEKEPQKPPEPSKGLMELLLKDKEKSLIMLLILILSSDEADTSLLLALMYLVM